MVYPKGPKGVPLTDPMTIAKELQLMNSEVNTLRYRSNQESNPSIPPLFTAAEVEINKLIAHPPDFAPAKIKDSAILGHFFAYFILSLLALGLTGKKRRQLFLILLGLAVTTEVLQLFYHTRTAGLFDVYTNMLGVVTAFLITVVMRALFSSAVRSKQPAKTGA